MSLSLAEKIANDWMQHKLATPEAALAYIRQRSQNKQTTTRYYGPRQVERGTDWSKKQAEQVDVTPEQLAALLDDEDEKKAGGTVEIVVRNDSLQELEAKAIEEAKKRDMEAEANGS